MMPASFDEKIIALQEKFLHQEDALQKLDDVIAQQYQLIDALMRRVKELEARMTVLQDELDKSPATITDEKPPHY